MVKVVGRSESVSVDEYAREVAALLTEDLTVQLQSSLGAMSSLDASGDLVVSDPRQLVEALKPLLTLVPEEGTNELAALVGPFWSHERTQQALGVTTRQALASRRRNGTVLGVKSADGVMFYPLAQFRRRQDGRVEVKPAIREFLKQLRAHDAWAVAVLLHTPAPELGGATPLAWERDSGDTQALAQYGRQVAAEWQVGAA